MATVETSAIEMAPLAKPAVKKSQPSVSTYEKPGIDKATLEKMATFKKLMALHEAGEISEEIFKDLAKAFKDDMDKTRGGLTISVGGATINLSRTTRHSELMAMWAVLNITELREEILDHVPAKDLLLNVQLVCRAFRDSVQSTGLKRQLYRVPDHRLQLPARLPYQLQGLRDARVTKNCIVVVPSKLTNLAKQSTMLRKTFICQPPRRTLKMESNFNPLANVSTDLRNYIIYNPNGITYGDVFDEIDKMETMGLIDEFRRVSILRGSEKLVWEIGAFPREPESHLDGVHHGAT